MDHKMHVTGYIKETFEHDGLLTRDHTEHGPGRRQVFDQLHRGRRIQFERLFQVLACKPLLGLSWNRVFALTAGFMIANLLLSRVLFHIGLREHPY